MFTIAASPKIKMCLLLNLLTVKVLNTVAIKPIIPISCVALFALTCLARGTNWLRSVKILFEYIVITFAADCSL